MYRFTNIYVLAAFGTIGGGKILFLFEEQKRIGDKCIDTLELTMASNPSPLRFRYQLHECLVGDGTIYDLLQPSGF